MIGSWNPLAVKSSDILIGSWNPLAVKSSDIDLVNAGMAAERSIVVHTNAEMKL